jgi:UDP:flavonoid glycosyltransferase YjiC (YdhE family)
MIGSEIALARALQARGHEVHLVVCDGVLPACENKSIGLSESEVRESVC